MPNSNWSNSSAPVSATAQITDLASLGGSWVPGTALSATTGVFSGLLTAGAGLAVTGAATFSSSVSMGALTATAGITGAAVKSVYSGGAGVFAISSPSQLIMQIEDGTNSRIYAVGPNATTKGVLAFYVTTSNNTYIQSLYLDAAGGTTVNALTATTGTFSGAVSMGALTATTGFFSSWVSAVGSVNVTGAWAGINLGGKPLAFSDGVQHYFYSPGSGGFIFRNAADTASLFSVNDTGAATFASNVTAPGFIPTSTTLDLSSLDQATWYPVTFSVNLERRTRFRIKVALDSGTVPTWSTHPSGFSVICDWTCNGSGWGTLGIQRTIHSYEHAWSTVSPVGGLDQMSNSSLEVVYLRGGGKYFFESDYLAIMPTIQTATYTINSQTVSPTTAIINNVFSAATSSVGIGALTATTGTFSGAVSMGALTAQSTNVTGLVLSGQAGLGLGGIGGAYIQGKAGSSYDFSVVTPAGSGYVLGVPTGTTDVSFLGSIQLAASKGLAIADGAPGTTTGKLYSVSTPVANTLMWNGSKVMTIGTVGQDQATLQAAIGMAVAPLVGTIAQRTAYSVPTGTLPYWYATDETAPDGQLGTLRLWSGSAWGSAATPSTVVGRVIAGTIAAGAVSTQALAANVVTAAKLNVSDINSAGTLTVTGAQITINGSTTFTGGMSTTGLVGAINGGSTNINGSRVVITGASGIVGAINTANGGSNTTTIDGGSITASSITTGLLAANAITAAKLESTLVISNLIESSDYTESSGVPTAGFKMDSAEATYKFKAGAGWLGTALKIGSGTYTLNDIGVRAIAGIDATGLTSTDVIWWRGNNDTTNNAGAPIILDPMYSRDQYYNVGDRVIAGTASTPAYNTGKAVYECTTAGLSIRMGQGTATPAAWNSGTAYNAGMPVSFSGNIFLSLKASTNVTPVVTANWSSGTTYAAGDQCYANSAIYYSLQGSNTNHTPPSPSAVQDSWWAVGYNPNGYWIDGGVLVYQGAYSGATTYTTGQTCLSNSRVFKSISGSTGQAPPTSGNNTYWTDLGNMYCPQGTLRATDSYVDGAAKWKCVGWMWGDVSSPGIHAWVRNTTYAVGDLVCSDNTYGGSQGYTGIINSIYGNPLGAAAISGLAYCGSRIYRCVTAGTTSAINYGPSGTGTGITDNAAVWDYWSENTGPEDRLQIWGISVDTPGSGFQWEARIQPKTNRDNLDALTHLEVEIRGTDGVWYGHDVVPYQTNVALPSRKYYSTNPVNHILNMTRTMFEFKAPGINNGYLFPQGSPYGVSGKLRVRLHNVYGASDAIDLVAWNAVNTVPTPYANNMSVVVQKGGGSQGWHHCPEGWVKVTTMRGDIRADEVVPGDKVPTFHESTGEFGVYRVSAVERSQSETVMLELRKTFSDETSVICELAFALNHKVLRNGMWESLSNIPNGTILQSTDGTKLEVLSISSRGMNDVVQIMVDDAHTYSTESLLSHNLKIM